MSTPSTDRGEGVDRRRERASTAVGDSAGRRTARGVIVLARGSRGGAHLGLRDHPTTPRMVGDQRSRWSPRTQNRWIPLIHSGLDSSTTVAKFHPESIGKRPFVTRRGFTVEPSGSGQAWQLDFSEFETTAGGTWRLARRQDYWSKYECRYARFEEVGLLSPIDCSESFSLPAARPLRNVDQKCTRSCVSGGLRPVLPVNPAAITVHHERSHDQTPCRAAHPIVVRGRPRQMCLELVALRIGEITVLEVGCSSCDSTHDCPPVALVIPTTRLIVYPHPQRSCSPAAWIWHAV